MPDRHPTGSPSDPSPATMASAAWLRETVGSMVERHGTTGELPPIVQLGHPALRMRAAEVDGQLDDGLLDGFLRLMRAVMHAAPGVGLAAPQLGVPLRMAVLEDQFQVSPETADVRERRPLDFFAALNPTYAPRGTRRAAFYEGCLSFAGFQGVVDRPADIDARWEEPGGAVRQEAFSGWQARIFQHETDHLDGIVYIDRALTRSLTTNANYLQRWASPGIEGARAGLGF
ncbi:peptide deformylase 1 [Zafaria cholistanensis]|uniref:Peptide deformylase n=1 Tax=Zafaria cholistanensis TaxID=1682741 RepID=A0A5A7NNK3_9MICC|nr:peptide deformylase [Zafaria cholistanensis]GER22106.1 peptide deformylase 1 [Zafaria cholistanensis]